MSTRDRDDQGRRDFDRDDEDLVVRARHGTLSPAEHDELAAALEASPLLATAYRVGMEIDRASAVQGGDDALIARAADAAMTRAHAVVTTRTARAVGTAGLSGAAAGSRWAVAAATLLSVVFASGIAAALWTGVVAWPLLRREREAAAAAQSATRSLPAQRQKQHKAKPAQAAPVAVTLVPTQLVIDSPTAEALPVQQQREATAAPQHARKASTASHAANEADEAAEQFHAANDARRNGELQRAQSLYSRLIAQHPSSDEAGLARVSLGRLLLSAGDARAAEREFRRYLAGGGGQLAEEALVGQAQSLGRLQRADEEAQVWGRLLATHPTSVYAAEAKQRLAALAQKPGEGATR